MTTLVNARKITNQYAFTLFEVLVAVSIFALIGTISMTNLLQISRSSERVIDAQKQMADLQFALGYFTKDINQLVNRDIRDQYGDEQPKLQVSTERVTFTRAGWSNLLRHKRSDLQRVEYRLFNNKLQRRYWVQLDQSYSEQVIDQDLLSGVEHFSIQLLTKSEKSYKVWPTDLTSVENVSAPVALQLDLEISGFGKVQRIYEIIDVLV